MYPKMYEVKLVEKWEHVNGSIPARYTLDTELAVVVAGDGKAAIDAAQAEIEKRVAEYSGGEPPESGSNRFLGTEVEGVRLVGAVHIIADGAVEAAGLVG